MENNVNLFKFYRENFNYTQREIAEYLGIEVSTYAGHERGEREADYSELKKLAKLYKITINQLIGQNEEDLIVISKFQYEKLEKAQEFLNEVMKGIKTSNVTVGDESTVIIGNNNQVKNSKK